MATITGIGETVLDVIFKDDKPVAAVPGGSTFNAMISLGRTVRSRFPGFAVRMVTRTGDDHIGDIVSRFMISNGVSTEAVSRIPGTQTHVSMAFLDGSNDASYEFYKVHEDAFLTEGSYPQIEFHRDDIVLFGSYFSINPTIRRHLVNLLESAKAAGATLYYDINFRKNHLKDLDRTIGNIEENLRLSDIVRGSADDFSLVFGSRTPEEAYSGHVARLCPNFIYTSGAGPVHTFSTGIHLVHEMPPIYTVSTIGAGDNFNAGFIFGLIENGLYGKGRLNLSQEQWKLLVKRASGFSANVCQSSSNYVDEGFQP